MTKYECSRCGTIFKKSSHYTSHVNQKHICPPNKQHILTYRIVKETFKCTYCEKKYSNKSSIDYHIKSCEAYLKPFKDIMSDTPICTPSPISEINMTNSI